MHSSIFQECLNFLKEIFGGSHDFSAKTFHHSGAVLNLYVETSSTFVKVLFLQLSQSVDPHSVSFSIFSNCVCRSLKLMPAQLTLACLLRKWKSCMQQLWILILNCRMVGLLQILRRQMDMRMILREKQTLTSMKCFLVSWPLMQWSKCLLDSRNLLWKGAIPFEAFSRGYLDFFLKIICVV